MIHRAVQFFEAGRRPGPADYALARACLPDALVPLFEGMHPRDIVHSANTARWLLARGYSNGDLIAAALLHDVGKGHQRRLDRVVYVLASATRLAGRLGDAGSGMALRQAVARSLAHASAGADRLAAAGADARVVELTRRHHSAALGDPVLALLQQADAEN